jgi:hypothetical protein
VLVPFSGESGVGVTLQLETDLMRPYRMLPPLIRRSRRYVSPSILMNVTATPSILTRIHGQLSLIHRRLFATSNAGAPDGVERDLEGSIYGYTYWVRHESLVDDK